jgi:uncharacterized pyridoxamine 5'-phosphate oxidase family protein
MQEIIDFLTANANGCLATVSEGKPRVRPWMFAHAHKGKLYFGTSNKKSVFQQLKTLPYVEFTSTSPALVTARVRGTVEFTGDRELKKKILDTHEMVRSIYQSPDNPEFELFCIASGEASLSDFSGQPPKVFKF